MFWWNLSPCSSLTAPIFSGNKSKWECVMWIFSAIFTLISWKFYNMLSIRCLWFLDFVFPKKLFMTAFTDNHVRLSSSVTLFSKSQSSISCRICGPSKAPSLILASLSLGNFFLKKKRPASPFLFNVLMKLFTMPSFIWDPDRKIFWGSTNDFWATFIFPGSKVSHAGQTLT